MAKQVGTSIKEARTAAGMTQKQLAEAAGSGLHGIALVKYVAKVHNGKLDIESRLGKGSVFTLTIPYF